MVHKENVLYTLVKLSRSLVYVYTIHYNYIQHFPITAILKATHSKIRYHKF